MAFDRHYACFIQLKQEREAALAKDAAEKQKAIKQPRKEKKEAVKRSFSSGVGKYINMVAQ